MFTFMKQARRDSDRRIARARRTRFAMEVMNLEQRDLKTGISIDPATMTLVITGTEQADTTVVNIDRKGTFTLVDDQVIIPQGIHKPLVFNLYQFGNQTISPVITNISYQGFGGDDTFENNTYLPSTIDGGAGNDTLTGGWGTDIILGGSGKDTIYGDTSSPLAPLGAGAVDYLWGDSNYSPSSKEVQGLIDDGDYINGGAGNDAIEGGLGKDYLVGGAGNDTIHAGDGDDCIIGGDGDDIMTGGNGNDTLYGDGGNDYIHGDNGDDYIDGSTGDDLIYGDQGNDALRDWAGTGNNKMYGGEGNDTLSSSSHGTNYMDGGSGNDDLIGGYGDDILIGGTGNDTLFGYDGNDQLFGGDGQDSLDGGKGNDYLDGGLDNYFDSVIGGEGSDTFLLNIKYLGGGIVVVDQDLDYKVGTDKLK